MPPWRIQCVSHDGERAWGEKQGPGAAPKCPQLLMAGPGDCPSK